MYLTNILKSKSKPIKIPMAPVRTVAILKFLLPSLKNLATGLQSSGTADVYMPRMMVREKTLPRFGLILLASMSDGICES